MSPFERLLAWRESHQLVLAVYRVTKSFPKHELYGITSQMRRAAVSVPSNIAEGSVKRGPAEFRRYLDIARASLAELQHQLILVRDLEYITREDWEALHAQQARAGSLTWRLYKSLDTRSKTR